MDKQKQGKNNRAAGKRFELKVRYDLESKGWIVFRNSMDIKDNQFKQTTGHWNPYTKSIMMNSSGFPDFVCARLVPKERIPRLIQYPTWHVKFVECKGGDANHKYLTKEEKEKVEWIKDKLKIPVFVANKGIKRGEIVYIEQ